MTRDLTAGMADGISAPVVVPILLFEGEFRTTTRRYWTGVGTLNWNSVDWLGVGDLITMEAFQETDDGSANGVKITVNGATEAAPAEVLQEAQNYKPGLVRLALLDESGAIVPDPKILFRGRLDTWDIDDSDPTKPVLVLSYEHEEIDLERPRLVQYTDADQQRLYPGDTGLRFISGLTGVQIDWGNGSLG